MGGASSGSVGWWWVPFIVQCSGRALLPSQNANNLQDIVFHYSKRPREPRELRPASERAFRRFVLTAPKRSSAVNANPTRADGVVMVVCLDVDSFH